MCLVACHLLRNGEKQDEEEEEEEEEEGEEGEGGHCVRLEALLMLCRYPTTAFLKGLCHEMNNFLKAFKIKLPVVLSVYAPVVFKLFCCLVMEKIKDKVLAF